MQEEPSKESAFISSAQAPSQSEIFFQEWNQTDNLIYAAPGAHVDSRLLAMQATWCQTFDLQDSALIVQVKGNQISFKLVHFSEKLLNDYYNLVQRNKVDMPKISSGRNTSKRLNYDRSANFMLTEEESKESNQKNELRALFEKTSTAKMSVEGFVVPNILFQWSQSTSTAPESLYFTLSILTTSNKLYILEMQSYFLLPNQSVNLRGPFPLSLYGSAKAIDLCTGNREPAKPELSYIIGTMVPNDQGNTPENFLAFAFGDTRNGFQTTRVTGQQENIAQNIKNKLIGGILDKVKGVKEAITGSKSMAQAGLQTFSRGEIEEGVVALKQLPNQIVAVVVTSGYLYLISCETERVIGQHDLLTNLDSRDERGSYDRVLKAKLDFKKRPFNYRVDSALTFDLVVAFSTHSLTTMLNTISWNLTELTATFPLSTRTSILYDDFSVEKRDLSEEPSPTLTQDYTQRLPDQEEVVELLYEARTQDLWLVTYSSLTKQSRMVDLRGRRQQAIWSREDDARVERELDRPEVQDELLKDPMSLFAEALVNHYTERILKKGRFNPHIMRQVLTKFLLDYKLVLAHQDLSNISDRDLVDKASLSPLRQEGLNNILNTCIQEETRFSKINGFSSAMSYQGLRFVVRDIGISIVKSDSMFSTLENRANETFLSLASLKANDSLSLSAIRQSLPQDSKDTSTLFSALLGAIKYLHLNSLLILDDSLVNLPEKSFKQLITHVFRNSTQNEALHYEIVRALDTSLAQIDSQLLGFAQTLVAFLEQHAQKPTGAFESSFFVQDSDLSIYSLPLLKVLERGLLKEIDQIYEVLRDLLMTWEFIDANSPMIMIRPEDVTRRQDLYEECEAWLRQIVALRQVITQEVRIESIQNEETANVVQLISCKADRPSYLTYLMVKNYQRSLSRQLIGGRLILPSTLFGRVLQHFLSQVTFRLTDEREKTFPPLIETLSKLHDSWPVIHSYLSLLLETEIAKFQTLHIELAMAFTVAKLNMPGSKFVRQIQKTILIYRQLSEKGADLDLGTVFLHTGNQREVFTLIQDFLSLDFKFYLVLLSQLKGLDQRYELYLLLTALEDPKVVNNSDLKTKVYLDLLYLKLYTTASLLQGGVDGLEFMYSAVMHTQESEQKRQLAGQFILHLYNLSQGSQLAGSYLSQYNFSQELIEEAQKHFVGLITKELPTQPLENTSNLQLWTSVLIAIAQIYSRQIETARYLWTISKKIDSLLSLCGPISQIAYRSMLKLQSFLLSKIYVYAVTYGEHLLLLDDTSVTFPSSNDQIRDRDQFMASGASDLTIDDLTQRRGLSGLLEGVDHTTDKFPSGTLRRVTEEDLYASLLLTASRLHCADYHLYTADPSHLVTYLSELRCYPLALDLALAFHIPQACYPVALMLKEYQLMLAGKRPPQEEAKVASSQEEVGRWYAEEMLGSQAEQAYARQVEQVLSRLTIRDKIDVAKVLSAEILDVPLILENAIVQEGQIRFLLEFYLTETNLQLERAIDLVRNNLPNSVETLADLDIQLLVLFLQTLDESLSQNGQRLKELREEEKERVEDLKKLVRHSDIECSEDFASDLEDFYLVSSTVELYQLAIGQRQLEKGFDAELDGIRSEIETTEAFLQKAKDGDLRIKKHLVDYFNSQQ